MIVVWRVTTCCNLACPFCAYDRRLPFARQDADPATIRAFCAALADYQRRQGDPVLVSWLGGEPLRWPELPALTLHATSLGLRVSATTNGTTLGSAAVRQHLLEHYAELTVSLDAAGPVHDALRGWPGAFAILREHLETLSAARRADRRPLKLRVNAVLLRHTINSFAALAREVATWGVDELTFNALGGRDRPEFFSGNRPTAEQLKDFTAALPALRDELAGSGLTVVGAPAYLDRLQASAEEQTRAVDDCGPGERFLFIDENGEVAPCSFTSSPLGVPVSTIEDGDAIAALPLRFQKLRTACRPVVCGDCPSTHVFQKFAPVAL